MFASVCVCVCFPYWILKWDYIKLFIILSCSQLEKHLIGQFLGNLRELPWSLQRRKSYMNYIDLKNINFGASALAFLLLYYQCIWHFQRKWSEGWLWSLIFWIVQRFSGGIITYIQETIVEGIYLVHFRFNSLFF